MHLDSQISTQEIEKEIGIPQSTVSRILRSLNYHAYHITLTQASRPHHILARINFCQWALQMVPNDPSFFRYVQYFFQMKVNSTATDSSINITVIIGCTKILTGTDRWIIKIDGVLWCGAE